MVLCWQHNYLGVIAGHTSVWPKRYSSPVKYSLLAFTAQDSGPSWIRCIFIHFNLKKININPKTFSANHSVSPVKNKNSFPFGTFISTSQFVPIQNIYQCFTRLKQVQTQSASCLLQLCHHDIRYPYGIRRQGYFIDAVKFFGVPHQELVCPDLNTDDFYKVLIKPSKTCLLFDHKGKLKAPYLPVPNACSQALGLPILSKQLIDERKLRTLFQTNLLHKEKNGLFVYIIIILGIY